VLVRVGQVVPEVKVGTVDKEAKEEMEEPELPLLKPSSWQIRNLELSLRLQAL
jgi:hypothetical protein